MGTASGKTFRHSVLVGARMRHKRQVMDLSASAVAHMLGMQYSAYHKLEIGRYAGMKFAQLVDLTTILKCSADYLLGLSDDPGYIPSVPGEQVSPPSLPAPPVAASVDVQRLQYNTHD